MLVPLRNHLCPRDPKVSSLLHTIKECYFTRMSVRLDPNDPGFVKSRWIVSEDATVDHLLDVFTRTDASSADVWNACGNLMEHLYWHKKRLMILRPKILGLPEYHRSKLQCLYGLGLLFNEIGNQAECKCLLTRALRFRKGRGSDLVVARVLRLLSVVNQELGFYKEGIEQARKVIEISGRLPLIGLASLLRFDKQLDAAGEAVSHAIDLIGEEGDQF